MKEKIELQTTITFVNGLNISIDNRYSFKVPLESLVTFCLKERAKHLRAAKPVSRLKGKRK